MKMHTTRYVEEDHPLPALSCHQALDNMIAHARKMGDKKLLKKLERERMAKKTKPKPKPKPPPPSHEEQATPKPKPKPPPPAQAPPSHAPQATLTLT